MLKAAWKAEKGEDDQYFCVSDDEERALRSLENSCLPACIFRFRRQAT